MKNIIASFVLLAFFQISAKAQVFFNIDLLADKETYLISYISEKDINPPLNSTANVQVVLKVPYDKAVNFDPIDITSYIDGISWIVDVQYEIKTTVEPYYLIAFSMTQSMTKNIQYKSGEMTPLFSFRNASDDCIGKIVLPDNDDFVVEDALEKGLNFTQSLTTLSKRANTFAGIENGEVDCALVLDTDEWSAKFSLEAFPVPTKEYLTIQWENPESLRSLSLEVVDLQGQLLQTVQVSSSKGIYNERIDVSGLPNGLYALRFQKNHDQFVSRKFLIAR